MTENPTIYIGLYFVLLSFGLFLGDGKQSLINVYGAAVGLVLWGTYLYNRKSEHIGRLPAPILLFWGVCGAAIALSTVFSDSIGLSISWAVRFVGAFLTYRLFFAFGSRKSARLFTYGAGLFVLSAALIYLLSLAYSPFSRMLPLMTLIDLKYGHSHLADLLVFVLPFLFSYRAALARRTPWVSLLLWVCYAGFLVLTLSRGAWLLVAAFVCYKTFSEKKPAARLLLFAGAGLFAALSLFAFTRGAYTVRSDEYTHIIIGRDVQKYPAITRFEYWRQAISSVAERPILGSGPGTFSLDSVRLQNSQEQPSWFAHSEPLQIAAETGLVGAIAFALLIVSHLVHIWRTRTALLSDAAARALLEGCAVLFIYGSVEFVLDYLVIWLVFWAAFGLVTRIATDTAETGAPR